LKKMLKSLRSEEGVTLIEIIIVVAIMGIIAAVAIPAVSTSISNSKANADKQNLYMVQNAVDRYLIDNPSAATITEANLTPAYLREVPVRNNGSTTCTSPAVSVGPATGNVWCYTPSTGKVN